MSGEPRLRDAFGIDAIPSVSVTMQQLYEDVSTMEEKAPTPSRYKSKERSSETQAWINAPRGEQDETEPEAFSRVERSPYVEDFHMGTPRSSSPTRRKLSPVRLEYGPRPYDTDDDDDNEIWTG